jgi:hypothetical protein
MSRNLCRSSCCENIVRLSDLRGKPIEFRQYGSSDPPVIGTRWDCPTCATIYFAWWRDAKWSERLGDYSSGFVIDLSYYATFNDEPDYDGKFDIDKDKPACLCEDDAENQQWVW